MTWIQRTSKQSRGYDAAWDRVRAFVLLRDNYRCHCPECIRTKRVLLANEVDHITPKAKCSVLGWTRQQIDDPSNLRAVNTECHKRLTQEQLGNTFKGNPNPPVQRKRIGLDGWPIDE